MEEKSIWRQKSGRATWQATILANNWAQKVGAALPNNLRRQCQFAA